MPWPSVFRTLPGRGLAAGVFAVLALSPWPAAPAFPGQAAIVRSELPATGDAAQGPEGYNSPGYAQDPADPRIVALAVRLDGKDFGCSLQLSGDGGKSWVPAAPVPRLPKGAEKCYAPEVAFDERGTLYYLFVGLQGLGNTPMGAYLTTSGDRGRTFSPPRKILGPYNFQVRMVIDRERGDLGRVHLVWLKALQPPGIASMPPGRNPVMSSFSDDGGRTFSKPVVVNDASRHRVAAPAAALGPKGDLWVAYYDLKDDARDYHGLEGPPWEETWELVVSKSSDGGESFRKGDVAGRVTPPGRVSLIFTMPPPSLAVSQKGTVYAAWTDGRHGDPDALVTRSNDDGRSWAKPFRANDDRRGNGRTQELPRIAVAPAGRLDVLFYDRRGDPKDIMNDVYLTSLQGGRSYRPNIKVNSASFSSQIGRRYGHPSARNLVEFGSRLGLVSSDASTLAAWTDTRNSTHPLEQHIFTATVEREMPRDDGAFSVVSAITAVVAGAALLVARLARKKGYGATRSHEESRA